MPIEKSAPGGREAAQENVTKPGHGANAMNPGTADHTQHRD